MQDSYKSDHFYCKINEIQNWSELNSLQQPTIKYATEIHYYLNGNMLERKNK